MKRIRRAVAGMLGVMALLLLAALPLPAAAESPAPDFYYFNPDSLQNNLGQLKSEMDAFFAESGYPVNFQPFSRLIDFNQRIREKRPAFLFLPHWYYEKYGAALGLQPLLQPRRQNKKTYNKVLLIRKQAGFSLASLKNRTLAMTSMGPDEDKLLDRLLFQGLGLSAREQRIVTVSKDADALFALALGQVDAALVVKQNLKPLAEVNERIMQSITPVAESQPLLLPLFCVTEKAGSRDQIERIKGIFLKTNAVPHPVKVMEMLQVDEWQPYDN
ncbi:MAG: PhnD/SsuA/transferrin family substrate-binding protein [Thermodesulfobacteriota bacterium]